MVAETSNSLRILSLGAGVQSTALLLMSCRGVLPRIDHAVFADTQWEPASVYEHLAWLESESAKAGIPVHRVTAGDLSAAASRVRLSAKSGKTYIAKGIPLFIRQPDGSAGLGMRQCTLDFKIVPVDRFCRPFRERGIEMWMGITRDEMQRMKDSRVAWKTLCYPFLRRYTRSGDYAGGDCNYLPRMWARQDCLNWLAENYPSRTIPRSACVSCPYHSNSEWRRLRDEEPAEFARAVEDEKRLQAAYSDATAMRGTPFLHRSMKPLSEAPIDVIDPQMDFSFGIQNECEGMCGV